MHLNNHLPDLELIVFKLHRSKRKWYFLGIYEPLFQNDIKFPNRINLILDYYLTPCEDILIADFNALKIHTLRLL